MDRIDIFYQGEGIAGIEHFEIDPGETFAVLKAQLATKHGHGVDVLIFLEDQDEPIDNGRRVHECVGTATPKLHLHRCRHVHVAVTFNNETVEHQFAPSATIARIKRWAAENKFKMSPEEAGEHVLQISGTQDRPSPGTHVGALTTCPNCKVAFDLVADERVNGAAEEGE